MPGHSDRTRLCSKCGRNLVRHKGRGRLGSTCYGCHANRHKAKRKEACEKCGFIPADVCQLDIDHIDGNRENNDPSNHMTLCANCHRLKTRMNRDWTYSHPPHRKKPPMTNQPTKIDQLADRAGSMTKLREIMGDVPWTTIGRWNKSLQDGKPLPRSAKLAIQTAEKALEEKEKAANAHT